MPLKAVRFVLKMPYFRILCNMIYILSFQGLSLDNNSHLSRYKFSHLKSKVTRSDKIFLYPAGNLDFDSKSGI